MNAQMSLMYTCGLMGSEFVTSLHIHIGSRLIPCHGIASVRNICKVSIDWVPSIWFLTQISAFSSIAGDDCVMASGDFNSDPYREPEKWLPMSSVWHAHVGYTQNKLFRPYYITVFNTTDPLPTWGVPGTLKFACSKALHSFCLSDAFLTLDYLIANHGCITPVGFMCSVLGVSPNTTRIDSPIDSFDHRALLCYVHSKSNLK
jgi:hypothetical protein